KLTFALPLFGSSAVPLGTSTTSCTRIPAVTSRDSSRRIPNAWPSVSSGRLTSDPARDLFPPHQQERSLALTGRADVTGAASDVMQGDAAAALGRLIRARIME